MTENIFRELTPFLNTASPVDRRKQSREFDARIAPFLGGAVRPQIQCFYQVLSDNAQHDTLIAATTSMRAAGHPVNVWSYSPQKLDFLRPHGIEVCAAADIVPQELFERVAAGTDLRYAIQAYFSDIVRYAALYKLGGLWLDTDVVMLRPFPFHGRSFFNIEWGSAHSVCGNVIYAEPGDPHMRSLYDIALGLLSKSSRLDFGVLGPKLLTNYISSSAGAGLRDWVFSPMFFNSINWDEIAQFERPISELSAYFDERVHGLHLWTWMKVNQTGRDSSLRSLLLFDRAQAMQQIRGLT
jgi:hypothetical protein